MNPSTRQYITGLLVVTAISLGVGYYANTLFNSGIAHIYPVVVVIVFAVTLGVHLLLTQSLKGKPQEFVRLFMLTSMGKMLLYLAIMVAYALLNRAHAVPFILSFLVVYIVFTAFDSIKASQIFRKNS